MEDEVLDEIEIAISREKLVSLINSQAKKLQWRICESCGFLEISIDEMVQFLQAILGEIGPVDLYVKDD